MENNLQKNEALQMMLTAIVIISIYPFSVLMCRGYNFVAGYGFIYTPSLGVVCGFLAAIVCSLSALAYYSSKELPE